MKKKYHFIAIGGVGMSGLAKYLLQKGYEVSGSDINDSKYVQKVRELGAKVYIGHDENNVPDDCVVVASTAIRDNNPEIMKAKRLGLPIWHRSDLLAEIAKDEEYFIGFSGTHGNGLAPPGTSHHSVAAAGGKHDGLCRARRGQVALCPRHRSERGGRRQMHRAVADRPLHGRRTGRGSDGKARRPRCTQM